MKKRIFINIAVVCSLLLGLNGCKANEEIYCESQEVFAMDTYMTVTAYGNRAAEAVESAISEINRLDDLLSTGKVSSEIYSINESCSGSLSEDSTYLLERSLELYESTEGAFNIAVYPVMEAWGFTDQAFRVPGDEELYSLLTLADPDRINFSKEEAAVSFENSGMKIDFGGIAKGYTSSRIMDIFKDYKIVSGLVSLGGNVQLYKTKTDGSCWRVGIQDPEDEQGYLGILEAEDTAIITSGGYERYFEEDGITYHHIIDPKTGYPADSGLTSVTIVSTDGTLADGLSTSLFIMGKEKASEYWRNHSDEFDVILFDGEKVFVSEGIIDQFTSDYEIEEISYSE